MSPGITVLPPRSTTSARGPAFARISALDPVAVMRPSRIATAATIENRSSTVTIFPFTKARAPMAYLACRGSSRLREALGELGGEGEDLPVRPVVELDLADQATLAVGEDG